MRPAVALAIAISLAAAAPALPARADTESQIGSQVYSQLAQKGEIIRSSPYYDILNPIARRISAVADPQYEYPFRFILVHEAQPNAFAVPGGNVYVTDSLMRFAGNTEELAGVLCHETSHTIHHDVVNNIRKDQELGLGISVLGALTGIDQSIWGRLAQSVVYAGGSLKFSRQVETNADLKGAQTCAQAGYNPWGMVWLFEKFAQSGKGSSLEMLSDHPADGHRIADLERYFEQHPALFGGFSPNITAATPLSNPVAPP